MEARIEEAQRKMIEFVDTLINMCELDLGQDSTTFVGITENIEPYIVMKNGDYGIALSAKLADMIDKGNIPHICIGDIEQEPIRNAIANKDIKIHKKILISCDNGHILIITIMHRLHTIIQIDVFENISDKSHPQPD